MRPSIDQTMLNVARVIAERSTCVRRKVGAVITDLDDRIIATGYNGVATGAVHCTKTPCAGANLPSGQGLNLCEAIHAEQNALVACDVRFAHTLYCTTEPCVACTKLILATRSIKRVVFSEAYPSGGRALFLNTGEWKHEPLIAR